MAKMMEVSDQGVARKVGYEIDLGTGRIGTAQVKR